jgi:hypothetical protein
LTRSQCCAGHQAFEGDENSSPGVSPKLAATGPTAKEIAAARAARVRLGLEAAHEAVVGRPQLYGQHSI